MSGLEESLFKISGQLSTISRNQKYFRTRENRNFSTVRSTESRILKFSLVEVFIMVTMAGLQVFVVKFFFQGARKGEHEYPRWFPENSCTNGEIWQRLCVSDHLIWRLFYLLFLFDDNENIDTMNYTLKTQLKLTLIII